MRRLGPSNRVPAPDSGLSLLPEEVQDYSFQVESKRTEGGHQPVGVEAGISVHYALRQIRLGGEENKNNELKV